MCDPFAVLTGYSRGTHGVLTGYSRGHDPQETLPVCDPFAIRRRGESYTVLFQAPEVSPGQRVCVSLPSTHYHANLAAPLRLPLVAAYNMAQRTPYNMAQRTPYNMAQSTSYNMAQRTRVR
jgi:hypothetical protein